MISSVVNKKSGKQLAPKLKPSIKPRAGKTAAISATSAPAPSAILEEQQPKIQEPEIVNESQDMPISAEEERVPSTQETIIIPSQESQILDNNDENAENMPPTQNSTIEADQSDQPAPLAKLPDLRPHMPIRPVASPSPSTQSVSTLQESQEVAKDENNDTESPSDKRSNGKSRKRNQTQMLLENPESMTISQLCHPMLSHAGIDPLGPPKKRRGRRKKQEEGADQEGEERASVPPAAGAAGVAPEPARRQLPPKAAAAGPRVRMVNGKIVLDEASLVVTGAVEPDDLSQLEHVEESHTERYITSASFWNKQKPSKWNAIETAKFYEGLRVFGTDFEMIARLFPERTRRQIKLKFNREERSNKVRVDEALKQRKSLDETGLTLIEHVPEPEPAGLTLTTLRKDITKESAETETNTDQDEPDRIVEEQETDGNAEQPEH